LPKYHGCFKEDHGFLHLIGKDITVKECFDTAKRKGYKYASLQEGNLCWADFKISGSATKEPNFECNWLCDKDKDMTCGGADRATIWDLIDYTGHYTERPLCNYYLSKPVDCSKHGGYDHNDLCM
jgi:hypothetical protein